MKKDEPPLMIIVFLQDELTLNEGEVITIVSRVIEDAGWWRGELDGKVGVFPDNFVKETVIVNNQYFQDIFLKSIIGLLEDI